MALIDDLEFVGTMQTGGDETVRLKELDSFALTSSVGFEDVSFAVLARGHVFDQLLHLSRDGVRLGVEIVGFGTVLPQSVEHHCQLFLGRQQLPIGLPALRLPSGSD